MVIRSCERCPLFILETSHSPVSASPNHTPLVLGQGQYFTTRDAVESLTSSTPQEKPSRRTAVKKASNSIPADTATRKEARKEEAKRKADEQAARHKAQKKEEEAERRRIKAAEAARLRAELQETRRREEEEATRKKAELEQKNRDLADRLKALENDPRALEKIAREEHNMQRPEEEVLVVLPQDQRTP